MARIENVTITNMCMVFDGRKVLVQDKKDEDYSGITFPGGHVEKGESLTDAVIREVLEETGLKISSPQLCGIKDWMREDGTRYMVLFYKTDKYEGTVTSSDEGEVSTAYRNCTPGKCNIDFAKEVFEYIVKCESAYIFVGDFSQFFDNLDHKYLKEKIKCVINEESLDAADYAIYKNITKFTYIEADDIESEKGLLRRDMRGMDKYFETDEFHEFKKNHLRKNLKDYQIPQGSSISAVYANVYMIDFDKKINDFITSQKGMYRRYCDDIIIVVPMTQEDVKGKNEEIAKFIYSTRDGIPNLELNEDKTEHFFYDNGIIEKIKGKSNLINYLGFTFDGKTVRIRDKSLFKFYCRAYRKIKKVKENTDEKSFNAGKKAIYHSYTHLGASKYSKDHGNFLTYAYKADEIFSQSKLLVSDIRNQVKKHWYKIDSKLKE